MAIGRIMDIQSYMIPEIWDYLQGEPFLLDKRPSEDILARWKRCELFEYSELYSILWYLKVPVPFNPYQVEKAEKIMKLHTLNINANDLPSEQIDFYYAWAVSTVSKPYICNTIRKKLRELGHIL